MTDIVNEIYSFWCHPFQETKCKLESNQGSKNREVTLQFNFFEISHSHSSTRYFIESCFIFICYQKYQLFQFDCCGVDGPSDWETNTAYETNKHVPNR